MDNKLYNLFLALHLFYLPSLFAQETLNQDLQSVKMKAFEVGKLSSFGETLAACKKERELQSQIKKMDRTQFLLESSHKNKSRKEDIDLAFKEILEEIKGALARCDELEALELSSDVRDVELVRFSKRIISFLEKLEKLIKV